MRSPEARVTAGCEALYMGAENRTHVLKSSKRS